MITCKLCNTRLEKKCLRKDGSCYVLSAGRSIGRRPSKRSFKSSRKHRPCEKSRLEFLSPKFYTFGLFVIDISLSGGFQLECMQ